MFNAHGAESKTQYVITERPSAAAATVDVADQRLVIMLARYALEAASDLPRQRLQQLIARGQRTNGRQIQLLELPLVTFVLAQLHLQDFDLRAEGKLSALSLRS